MLKKHYNYKKIKIMSIFAIIAISFVINKERVNAATIKIMGPTKIEVGETTTITVDFGTYIGAYDLFQLTYISRILEYTGTEELNSKCWFDNTATSKGIRFKTFTFKGKKDGTSYIKVIAQGLVSANSTIDELGDAQSSTEIVVGDGIEKGDLNKDGLINSTDAAIVLDIYKSGNVKESDLKNGDVNEDRILNSTDAAMILDIYKDS